MSFNLSYERDIELEQKPNCSSFDDLQDRKIIFSLSLQSYISETRPLIKFIILRKKLYFQALQNDTEIIKIR